MKLMAITLLLLLCASFVVQADGMDRERSTLEREYDMGTTSLIGDADTSLLYDASEEVTYGRSITEDESGGSLLGNDIDGDMLGDSDEIAMEDPRDVDR